MIKWSFSSLKQYTNCPRQYYEIRVQQNFQTKETEQIKYGKEVHKALEEYVRDGTPLAKNYTMFKPMVDAIISVNGSVHVEHQMALDANKRPCDFYAPEYWVRGVADLLILSEDTAFIVDYKTGSARYPDSKQLKLMALIAFEHFPQIKTVKGGLLFVLHNSFMTDTYHKKDSDELWSTFDGDLFRLNHSFQSGTWPANPTPLCGWCPVKTCEFHKER